MSDLELEREVCFKDVHYNKCGKNNPNLSSTFWYKLVGTGIGTAIIIKCPICGEEEDITDTSTW